ncbi:concanavalin A-like lectin/glucanase domain-containing protein [Fimicolochytrium jonesii]|uniref:concanavalin A-like lectin/glucanase domain-containing protein n=1 Tax=Fimicolochytrium jonesii TaxID=1396493 RepID=UPI0022FF36A8|nr:concanavalin A-like lectin/glucanase domain-containing protein [Fimicolochytrium jonesii]KAI8816132.1 concanavalin A-like lectin/glucanase domain-containing protein [Fimicolochytrium jonesii]
MIARLSASILTLQLISTVAAFRLVDSFSGPGFFDNFDFFTADDPTHGYVDYVDRGTAQSQGLIQATGQQAFIRPDSTNVASGRGRKSVRLQSKKTYNQGSLIIADVAHMPVGCGTWPAFWTVGPNWPNSGEIDIIEGVNTQTQNLLTLHTSAGCTMAGVGRDQWAVADSLNCDVNAPGQFANQGCASRDSNTKSYGTDFNNNGGGVYATLWDASGIKIYLFFNDIVPADVRNGNPNPAGWGRPTAVFPFGNNCPASHFANHQIVINTAFCGDWAGAVFGQNGCPGNCVDFVRNNPGAFRDAYWAFKSVKVYQQ